MSERDDFRVCSCIRIDCWHPKGQCDEPPVARGGICVTCRWYGHDKGDKQ